MLEPGEAEIVTGRVRDKQVISSSEFPKPLGPYSQAVVSGGFLFGFEQQPGKRREDLNDFDAMNEVYREFFHSDYPACTTVRAVLRSGRKIEIDCIARQNR